MTLPYPRLLPGRVAQFSPQEREEMVEALRACKAYVWTGDGDKSTKTATGHFYMRHICLALHKTALPGVWLTRNLIAELLSERDTYGSWLTARIGYSSVKEIQQGRHAWIDHMIEALSV